jgi:prepilin-type N-terminal cleavage/methylation domain-containing protein
MKRGYTLVEMMVVVALLSVVGVAVVTMFLTTSRGGGKAGAIAQVKQEGDYALTTMERYIHFAKSVNPCTDTPPMSAITITWYDEVTGLDTNVTFNSTSGQIQRDGVAITSSNNISASNLLFNCATDATSGVVSVGISFDINYGNGLVTETFSSKVVLRNKATP